MDIGERIYELRTSRTPKLTQAGLAELAGVSVDLVSKLEQGRKKTASLPYLTRIARALDTTLSELLSRPGRLIGESEADAGLLELRQALTPLIPAELTEADEPATLAALRSAWDVYYLSSDFDALAAMLPGLLTDSQRYPAIQAEAYRLAACLASRIGVEDLAYIAGGKALEAAARADDEGLRTTAEATIAWTYLNQGRAEEGLAFAVRRVNATEPRFGSAPAKDVAVWGNLVVTAATAASRAGKPDQARDLLRLAAAAASVTGERVDHYTSFGPGQVAMQTVDAAVVAEDFTGALSAAKNMPARSSLRPVSIARHLEDVALAQTRLRRDAEAIETLGRIEQIAPKWIVYEPLARSIVSELVERERRVRTPTLRALAQRLRVAA